MIIEDGSKGYTAKVNPDGHLVTRSIILSDEHYVSSYGEGAYLVGNPQISLDGTNQCCLMVKNLNNNYILHVEALFATCQSSDGAFVSVTRNPVYVSGGSAAIPENMNFGLNKTPNVEAWYGNNMFLSNNTHGILGGYIAKGFSEFPFNGALLLYSNDSIAMCIMGTNATYATLGMRFYFAQHNE
jgi:hypothetical protein